MTGSDPAALRSPDHALSLMEGCAGVCAGVMAAGALFGTVRMAMRGGRHGGAFARCGPAGSMTRASMVHRQATGSTATGGHRRDRGSRRVRHERVSAAPRRRCAPRATAACNDEGPDSVGPFVVIRMVGGTRIELVTPAV